jgi:putative endopeptidase
MMRFALLATTMLAGSALLASCAPKEAPAPAMANAVVEVTPPAPEPAKPAPQIGAFGFDETGMDKAVTPGDSFYGYANGLWAKNTPIPADKSNYGSFNLLADLSQKRTQGILEEARGDPNSKIGVAYSTYLDTATSAA